MDSEYDEVESRNSNGNQLLDKFKKDERLSRFLSEEFDSTKYISTTIKSSSIDDSISQLSDGLSIIDKELNLQVASHHEELLSQVTNIRDLESMLEVVRSSVDSLQLSVDKIAKDISEPSSLIKARTTQLSRLQACCELLRKVIRFLYLSRKLQGHIQGGSRELAKAAQCVLELENIRSEADLGGINVIDAETRWIVKAGNDVANSSSKMLSQGLETLNQAEVAASMQVFYNLGTLKSKVTQTITALGEKASQSIRTALNPTTITEESPVKAKAILWTRVEKMMDILHVCCVQVWHLQRVLSKIRDPVTHVCLIDEIVKPGEMNIIQSFWNDLTMKLREQFDVTSKVSSMVEGTFVSEFPKLYRFFQDFLKRLQNHYEIKQIPQSMSADDQIMLLDSISRFKNSYLNRSISRLLEAINKMFQSQSAVPLSEDIVNLGSLISGELEVSRTAPAGAGAPGNAGSFDDLTLAVARGIGKSLKLFAAKSENMILTDPTAYQLTETATPAQLRNAKLFNNAFQLYSTVNIMMNNMHPQIRNSIKEPLNELEKLGEIIISPLFARVTKILEQVLTGIHREDFAGNEISPTDAQPLSQYMRTLQNQIAQYQSVILSKYTTSSNWIASHLQSLASRLVLYFVRHATLLRPLGEAGKIKLAADMAQLEFAVAPLQPLKQLGYAYRALRALRPFIFRETGQIAESPEAAVLPPSAVLHHLFSRGPPTMQSPHQVLNWNVNQYSNWIDSHSEEEIWMQAIKPALEAYVSQVNARREKEFSPIYPIILSLGPALLLKWKEKK
eukprot:TRINITY_DN7293_c0_g1_i1.p1 TRINITY_DN7293_c0_g1~~TRINITY_DN7293_c0_g1_i1.p1  ORF type:complete len:805 (-),score=214.23 TRINITY_DN7293_c0_g1_i1:12-2381(-)